MSGLDPPSSIGRYEVVGRLAAGGMAEVLLGRLRGPHGFERPVVIKRILPHLRLEPGFTEMFLDEARIIANLRHPNLLPVHELGRDGDELFMVMEFLEGEPLSGLCRRLAVRDEHIDFDLAAHIVAEACAGLHAAHEAKDSEGRALHIVHRDVSPQNIFVTYAGAVHVIDFGIATTVDRVSRTEAGAIRGKFEYLSPEQLRGVPPDRRADVFALGVVLLEVASGHRVYRREGHAETVNAILSESPPRLGAIRPGAPDELDTICRRALAKERADRYASAAEMRRELLAFARKRSDADPTERLGALMKSLFPDRIREKEELLRRVRSGGSVAEIPAAEVDVTVVLPTAIAPSGTSAPVAAQVTPPPSPPRPRSSTLVILALGVVAMFFVVAAAVVRRRTPPPTIAPIAAAATAPAQPTTKDVHIRIESTPVASVSVAGVARGTTPVDVAVDRASDPVDLELHADGFVPVHRTIVPDGDKTLSVELAAVRAAPSSRAASAPRKGAPPTAPRASSPMLW